MGGWEQIGECEKVGIRASFTTTPSHHHRKKLLLLSANLIGKHLLLILSGVGAFD